MLQAVLASVLLATCLKGEQLIAFRYDADHVLVFADDQSQHAPAVLDALPKPASIPAWVAAAGVVEKLPLGIYTAESYDDRKHVFAVGDVYSVRLSGETVVQAELDQLVRQEGCGSAHAGALAKIRNQDLPMFRAAAAKGVNTFVAEGPNSSESANLGAVHRPITEVKLGAEEQAGLEATLNTRMKTELQKIMQSPDTYDAYRGGPPEWRERWKTLDEALLTGKAKLSVRLEDLDFGGSSAKMRVARALWSVGGKSVFFLFATTSPGSLELQSVDANASAYMRIPEMLDDSPGFDDMDVPVNAFKGEGVLLFNRGYESFGIKLFRISPNGLVDTGVGYGDGC